MNGQNMDPRFDYTPISMWGYFGYSILFAIPIVGFILAIVWSFSATNINLRNFSRSRFCMLIIMVVLIVIMAVCGVLGSLGQDLANSVTTGFMGFM